MTAAMDYGLCPKHLKKEIDKNEDRIQIGYCPVDDMRLLKKEKYTLTYLEFYSGICMALGLGLLLGKLISNLSIIPFAFGCLLAIIQIIKNYKEKKK